MNKNDPNVAGPVAVIAVHGVADQSKDETAMKAANLLLHLDKLEKEGEQFAEAAYEGFREEKIHIGVAPLDVSSVGDEDAWHYQLREHLVDYEMKGNEGAYETIRMEGERLTRSAPGSDQEIDCSVHIYEMHWADVSKLKVGVFNIFLAVYRLLFETSWLGKQTIGKWASFGDDVGKMSFFTSLRGVMLLLHSIATAILTRFMPVMYLLMIGMLTLTGIPIVESKWASGMMDMVGGYPGLFSYSIVILLAIVLISGAFAIWRRIPWAPVYVLVMLVCFVAGISLFAALQGQEGSWRAEAGLALVAWTAFCLPVLFFVLPLLNRVFPGTMFVGIILIGYFTVGLVLGLAHKSEWPIMMSGALLALRLGFALMPIAWIVLATAANLFLILAVLESISLWFRRWLGKEVIQRRRSRIRTGILSITLPVLLISFLNSTFFQLALIPAKFGFLDGVRPVATRTLDEPRWVQSLGETVHEKVEPMANKWSSLPDFEKWTEQNAAMEARFSDYAKAASLQMVVPFLEAIFLIIILVLGYSLWIVAPAALTELKPWTVQKGKKWEAYSKALGNNLTKGTTWLWIGQVILIGCLFATQGLFAYRGIRAGQVRAEAPGTEKPPLMVLVDQFLGLRSDEEKKQELAVAEPVPSPVEEGIQPGAGTNRPDFSGDSRLQPLPDGAMRQADAPRYSPNLERPSYHPGSDFRRARIRESIEEIWHQRDPNSIEKRDSGRRDPGEFRGVESSRSRSGAPAAADNSPSSFLFNLLTEIVVFFNGGPLTSALGIFILFLALGYLFLARLADPLLAGLRGGLDMALDVVNYLRPLPRDRTSRAQILSRYASLLKYIVDWRDPQNPDRGYSRIVILAHSQGNVITSDLLRALSSGTVAKDNGLDGIRETPESVSGIPIRLLSMGAPLRQLYTARFPDLYAWDPKADPRKNHRGLESWWNVYRSGDYVGRTIFREITDRDLYVPDRDFILTSEGKDLPVRETCIGPGAHTHYWNESAPPSVVRKFDCFISCVDVENLPHNGEVKPPAIKKVILPDGPAGEAST